VYKCWLCSKKYKSPVNLKRHLVEKHNEQWFTLVHLEILNILRKYSNGLPPFYIKLYLKLRLGDRYKIDNKNVRLELKRLVERGLLNAYNTGSFYVYKLNDQLLEVNGNGDLDVA